MNEGFYVDACLDAMDSSPARMDEVVPAFRAALDHYGIALPTRDEAVWQLIEYHLRQITSGTVDAFDGLSQLITDVYWDYDFHTPAKKFFGDSHDIANLVGLYWGADDLRGRPNEVSLNGKYGAEAWSELGREIRAEAERWVEKNAR